MLSDTSLPGAFCIKEDVGRIFIFKVGYEDLVVGRQQGVSLLEAEGRQEGEVHRAHTASWAVAPPGVLTVAPPGDTMVAPQTPKEPAPPVQKTATGRAGHPCIPLGEGGTAIVRRVRHGGLWGGLMGDILWGRKRPVQELVNANKALERGIPTAEMLGLRLERRIIPIFGSSLPLYRAEVISKEIPETVDLLEFLSPLSAGPLTQSVDPKRREIIRAVAQAVRAMHEGGLYHNDLHLKNILVTKEPPFKAYVIDLDKSTLHESLSMHLRIKNILRLDRSVEKLMDVARYRNRPIRSVSKGDRLRFLRDYMDGAPIWKELARGLKPRHTFHRWWWKINKKLQIKTSAKSVNQCPAEQARPLQYTYKRFCSVRLRRIALHHFCRGLRLEILDLKLLRPLRRSCRRSMSF